MADPVSYDLHASLGYHLSLAARLMERRLDDGLKALGLTRITWCVLLAVGAAGRCQPSEIASYIGIDRTATSRALRQMEADGLLQRRAGTGDRRTTTVALTPRGRRVLEKGVPVARDNNAAMHDKLSDGEMAELQSLLARLTQDEIRDLPKF